MRANQLRLWFASMAYVLLCALRRIGLAHSQFADATCGTIRLKLLKIGALVRISVRRIKVAMSVPGRTNSPSLTPRRALCQRRVFLLGRKTTLRWRSVTCGEQVRGQPWPFSPALPS